MAPKNPQSFLKDAQKLEQEGDIAGAIKLYKTYLSRFRDHPYAIKVRTRAAQLSSMIGDYEGAIKMIEHAGAKGYTSPILVSKEGSGRFSSGGRG